MRPPDAVFPASLPEPVGAMQCAPPERRLCETLGVLVVDDEHLVRAVLQLGLERDGFTVWSAASGKEAIRLYRTHKENIGVVLLDIRMPGLDGPQTLDALRELNPGVLACFMTGNSGGYLPEELMQRGAVHIIDKPFQLSELADLLRLIARGDPAKPDRAEIRKRL